MEWVIERKWMKLKLKRILKILKMQKQLSWGAFFLIACEFLPLKSWSSNTYKWFAKYCFNLCFQTLRKLPFHFNVNAIDCRRLLKNSTFIFNAHTNGKLYRIVSTDSFLKVEFKFNIKFCDHCHLKIVIKLQF